MTVKNQFKQNKENHSLKVILQDGETKMVDTTDALESKYLTAELVKASPTKQLEVIGEGNYMEVTYEGETSNRLTVPIRIDNREKLWRPNRDSVSNLQVFGRDSKTWVGHKAKLQVVKIQGKDSIIAMPLN